jgi:formylglycine-generating enzyme required for sulfatase activity
VILVFASFPIAGILKGPSRPPEAPESDPVPTSSATVSMRNDVPIREEMAFIPPGPFIRGTTQGGFDELPERTIYLDGFFIDRYEVTNAQYQAFIRATAHRKAAPPSRYAKDIGRMSGVNQPVTYVSWDDANAYCRWKGKRLPTEAEWEKGMRGSDGRLWPWGSVVDVKATNWSYSRDGFEATAPVGSFPRDVSPYGVADGAGNVMEWVGDWYGEDSYRETLDKNPQGPAYGVFRVLRGGGYTSTGTDVRITSRSKMVPDFRDETIGFRCAMSGQGTAGNSSDRFKKIKENRNNKG